MNHQLNSNRRGAPFLTKKFFSGSDHVKKIITITALICAPVIISLTACNKEKQITVRELDAANSSDRKIIDAINESDEDGIIFPEGAKAYKLKTGKTRIMLPAGMKYIFRDKKTNQLFDGGGVDVTCTCTDGTGCSPVKQKGKYYCVMGEDCKTCTKSTASLQGAEVTVAGVYNKGMGMSIITKTAQQGLKDAVTSTPDKIITNATDAFFAANNIRPLLMQFYTFIYCDSIPSFILQNKPETPDGYTYIGINIYGNLAAVPVPADMAEPYLYLVSTDNKISCNCNDTKPKGCVKNSFLGAVYCDATGCKSCTLIDGNGL